MNRTAKNLIVYSLASLFLIGVGAPVVQAAPQNRDERQQEEHQRQRPGKPPQTRVEQQRPNVQRQDRDRTEQQRLNTQRQERERAEQHRLNTQRQERERAERQRLIERRADERRRQEHENRIRDNNIRRHIYNNDRYRAQHWRESDRRYEHRQPWNWYSRDHVGRRIILDDGWNREFPGLRSYRWSGPGFWYQGVEYRDVVLFYDDGDALVSVGFWDDGQFIMIRDDNRRYYNSNPFVIRYRDSFLNIRITL